MAEGWNNRMGVASRMAPGIVLAAAMLLAQALPAYGASEWQTYLEDDFSSAETMFYTGQAGEAFYAIDDQGRYVIDGLTTASDSLTALTDNLYYYYLEGQCELLRSTAGELAFNGLVFHYNKSIPGKLSYYVFYVYGDGYYGAKRVTGDSVDIIIPLTPTDLLDPYGVNILGVDAQGTRFDLYLNGRYVDGFTDVLIDGGGFGFYISKLSRGAFDDFTVKIERRAGGREETSLPAVTMSNVADGSGEGSFSGRRFPVIPKDPNRPTYSWEVGVDKTGKGSKIKDEPPVESLATELTPVAPEHIPPVTPAPEPAPASAPMVEPKPEAVPEPVAEPEPEPEPEPEIKPESVPEPAPSDGAAVADAAPVVETLRPVAPAELRLPPGEELIEAPPIVASGTAGDEVRVTTETVTDGAPPVSQLLDVTTYGAPVADAAPGEAQEVTPVATPPVEEPAPEPEPAPAPRLLTAPVIPRIESPFAQAPRDAGEPPAQEADTPPEPMADEPAAEAPSEDTVEDEPLMLLPAEEDTVAMQIGEPTPEPASEAPIAEQPAALEPAEELLLSLLPAAEDREATQPRMPEDRQPETGLPPAEPTVDTGTAEDAPRQPSAREIADAMRDHSDWGETDDVAQDYGVADGFDDDSGGIDLEPIRKAPVEPPATQPEPDSSTASAEELLTETSDAEPTLSLLPSEDATPVPEQQGDRVVFSATQPKYEGLDDLANRRAAGDDAAPADDTGTLELGLLPSDDGQPTLTAPVDDYFSREGLIVIEDDFSEESWPVSEGGAGNYRYFGAAYEIDNTGSATMAISYQNAALADCELNVDVEFLDGDSLVGFGLAGRFRVVDGRVSYYGLFVSQSGEFLLLKVLDGAEHVLADWTAATTLKPGASNRITLDLRGNELAAVINGEVVVTVQDMSIADGGYALLAGPGTAVRFDELLIRGYQR